MADGAAPCSQFRGYLCHACLTAHAGCGNACARRRAALTAAGYGLTLSIFYPGIMTFDAKFVYEDIAKGVLGDWQSPVMTVLWALIDPIAPGAGSMFLLIATSYWLGFGVLAFALARRASRLALLLPLLALLPPAFVFVGIIWRDVLFAAIWLLAAAIAFAAAEHGARLRGPAQALGLALCALGVLLRPNALIAAPILAAYIAWPMRISVKRPAVLFVPAMAGFFALVQVTYYGALGATRQHPLQSIMVFDLGGISHFAGENQFPVSWNETETALLLDGCYQPTQWDIYWRFEPCDFVMRKLEREERLFGTPAVTDAWIHAITRHPVAYLTASRFVHVEFPRRQQLDHVGCRYRAPEGDGVCGSPGLRRTALPCTICSSRRRCFGPARGSSFASSCAASPGDDVRRRRARLRWAFADRPPSMWPASLQSAWRRISATPIGRFWPASPAESSSRSQVPASVIRKPSLSAAKEIRG